MNYGKFIVLEGIDGSGTTTQAGLLTQYLFERDKQNVILLTREPTKLSAHGLELRRRLTGNLEPGEEVINDPEYWADLFIRDRKWHLEHIVIPNIQKGLQVISDRHKLSTIAYQSAQGSDMDELIRKHQGLHAPDLTLLLNVPAEQAAERTKGTRLGQEYFDHLELQKKIAVNYLTGTGKLSPPEQIVILDGSPAIDVVAKAIQKEVNKLYGYK